MLVFKSIKMLKFEWKCGNWSKCWNLKEKGRSIKCWYFIAKVGINQNVGIWLKNKELIRILKFWGQLKVGNQSRCWNLNANRQIDQNVDIWVKSGESKIWHLSAIRWKLIKMFKFERKMWDWSNVDILLQKWESIKMLEFDWKIRNWSEYWNLKTIKSWESIKMLKFEC